MIYGTKGSAAQKYAKSAGFTFVEVKKYTDSASGVSVYANVPTGSELKVLCKAVAKPCSI